MLLTDCGARFVVGHRGAPAHAPENTLAGFARALELGASALELDLHLSADGVPVVIHDPRTGRVAGTDRPVAECTAAELASLDAGHAWSPDGRTHPWRGRGAGIPTLEQVLATTEVPLILDIKVRGASQAVIHVLRRHSALDRVLVGGFDEEALAPFSESGVAVAGGRGRIARLWRRAAVGLSDPALDAPALAVPARWRGLTVPTRRFVRQALARGAAVHVWTVDHPSLARRLWARGASGIITNDPGALAAVTPPPGAGAA